MHFLHHKVILTKDNNIKRNWTRNDTCSFCDIKESVQHFFFECLFAKIIRRIIYMSYHLAPPMYFSNLFGNWLKGIS
jgi:hypothetical protein